MAATELAIAITGAGGAGVISVGELLLRCWADGGGRGLLRKAFGPQIRGGESAALVTLCDHEAYTAADAYDLLLALDWSNFERFGDEINLRQGALVICEDAESLPAYLDGSTLNVIACPFRTLAAEAHAEGRVNMLALGILGKLLGLDGAVLRSKAQAKLAGKAEAYRDAAAACIDAGYTAAPPVDLPVPTRGDEARWYLSGNQAAGYAVLQAGIRFVAAYPITPASDALEYLARPLERLGGELVQAEDELAAINMALGAAYGGVPAFTATSGPGLALMTESIGLAVASETPVTILNVMRGGPSTGIPTKSEQSDLNIALHGLHGDAPHLVLAPLSVADCVFTAGWAVHLAQHYQTAAIVLSDQFIGQSTAVVSRPREAPPRDAATTDAGAAEGAYERYALTESGLSPMAVPGDADRRFTADGLEHNPRGTPSASARDHHQQLEKRARKLLALDPGDDWGEARGDGEVALVCFGSASAAVHQAARQLTEAGTASRSIALRLLSPLPMARIAEQLDGCHTVFVVEQNHGAQLLGHMRAEMALAGAVHSIALPGPVPLSAARIVEAVTEELGDE